MPWNTGWENQGAVTFTSVNVAAGEPGIDVSSAGALLVGDNTATSIEMGASTIFNGATTETVATQQVRVGLSGGTPRVLWDAGSANQLFEIDNSSGTMRWLNGAIVVMSLSQAQVLTVPGLWGFDAGGHLLSLAAGTPATSGLVANLTSATPSGSDMRGIITLVVAAGGIAAGSSLCTVTFATSFGATAPFVLVVNQNKTNLANVDFFIVSQATGVSFVLGNSQALVVGTYIVSYIVIG